MGVRFGIVTDSKLIKKYKSKYGTLWFADGVQLNTLLVRRYDGQFFSLDPLDMTSELIVQVFVNKKSLPPVSEISTETY